MKITGTLIKNYFHCKRQAWLYYKGINFYSELTRIGKLKHIEHGSDEIVLENIKLDKINDKEVIEFKKTSSNLEGTKAQLLFYLYKLKEKGIDRIGRLKDLTYKDEYKLELDKKNLKKIKTILEEIKSFLKNRKEIHKRKKYKKDCKQCSFFDYCWIE
ncbi:MAG: hypothetical protein MAG795_00436 [Candidatus Woesearchaeota archaeon]|nr:hypothetical protein [Candidatus Woesearchaeota archaeon]